MKKLLLLLVIPAVVIIGAGCDEANEVLQKGTITGKVLHNDVAVDGAIIMLLEEGEMLAGGAPLDNATITGAEGNYRLLLVEPNHNYYVCAIKDNDGDLQYDPLTDQIGYYGDFEGVTWVPTAVSVVAGQTLNDINIRRMVP